MKYIRTLKSVLRQTYTYVYVVCAMITLYVVTILFSQGSNILNSVLLDIPFIQKIKVFISYFISFQDSFSVENLSILLITACIVGLQFAVVRMYAKDKLQVPQNKLSFVGVGSVLLGCMACCGSIVFALLSGFIGVSIQAVMPFGGAEFSFVGLAITLLALFLTIWAYHKPSVC